MSILPVLVGALWHAIKNRRGSSEFIFHGDNQIYMKHVFDGTDPTTPDGKHNWPGIVLARALYHKLAATHTVSGKWLSRMYNAGANNLARTALRDRDCIGWMPKHDVLCDLPCEFAAVFRHMGRLRRGVRARPEYDERRLLYLINEA